MDRQQANRSLDGQGGPPLDLPIRVNPAAMHLFSFGGPTIPPANPLNQQQPNNYPAQGFGNPMANPIPAGAPPLGMAPDHMAPSALLFDPNTPPPFTDLAEAQKVLSARGVVKVANIPYTISVPEMSQFLLKYFPANHLINAHVEGYPVHIIMERSTGKTMDCYVEFKTPVLAANDWEHSFGLKRMSVPKIGSRNVEVILSNQAELMKDMFPRAKCVHFDPELGTPTLIPNRDVYSSGYKGFLTTEELTCMVRHAETPQRSQFAARSMNRTFECMISTLYKFPWGSNRLYSVRQVEELFKAYLKQLEALVSRVKSPTVSREVGLDTKLLLDLIFAGLNAAGFSERQKNQIYQHAVVVGTGFPISKHAAIWPFKTLSAFTPTLTYDDIRMWLGVLNFGMEAMESQGEGAIGLAPYLLARRDGRGCIVFEPTEKGLDLNRAQYSYVEKKMMVQMIRLGWEAYEHRTGIAPPLFDPYDVYSDNGPGNLNRAYPFPAFGNHGTFTQHRQHLNTHDQNNINIDDDDVFIEFGEVGGDHDGYNDPEAALAAMRAVCEQTRNAPPGEAALATGNNTDQDTNVEGLGAGLDRINLTGNGGIHHAPRFHQAPNLNPEVPAFQLPRLQDPQAEFKAPEGQPTPSTSNSSPSSGAEEIGGTLRLGNGGFLTPPARINAGRFADDLDEDTTLTKTPAGARPQSTPSTRTRANTHNFDGRFLAFERTEPSPSANVQRRGITIRDPNTGKIVTNLLQSSSARGPGAAGIETSPTGNRMNGLQIPRARTRNATISHDSTGKAKASSDGTFDDTLDTWFNEDTTTDERMVIAAGMNMRSASAGTLTAPSTPPRAAGGSGLGGTILRRSPERENLRVRYEFDERLPMFGSQPMAIVTGDGASSTTGASGRVSDSISTAPTAPNTPEQANAILASPFRTPNRPIGRGILESPYRPLTLEDPDTATGGVRLPGAAASSDPTDYGGFGDGSPRRHLAHGGGGRSNLGGSPYPQIYTVTEGTARTHGHRMERYRKSLSRTNTETIDEEDEWADVSE